MAGELNIRFPDVLKPCNLADLRRYQVIFETQMQRGPPSAKAQEDFAYHLIRSKTKGEIQQGIIFLEDLYSRTVDDCARSEYLFLISVGYTRLKEYESARRYCTAILRVEPHNQNALELRDTIKKLMQRDGLIGIAVVGGAAAIIVGGIVGFILLRSHK